MGKGLFTGGQAKKNTPVLERSGSRTHVACGLSNQKMSKGMKIASCRSSVFIAIIYLTTYYSYFDIFSSSLGLARFVFV